MSSTNFPKQTESERQLHRVVLVIDDDETDRELVVRWLGKRFAVSCAASATDGLSMLGRINPACVILDQNLSDAFGHDLMPKVLERGAPVIFLTGMGDERLAADTVKAGAWDYFSKSRVTQEELCHAVEAAVREYSGYRRSAVVREEMDQVVSLLSAEFAESVRSVASGLEEFASSGMLGEQASPGLLSALEEARGLLNRLEGFERYARTDEDDEESCSVDLRRLAEEVADSLGVRLDDPATDVDLRDLPVVFGRRKAMSELIRNCLLGALQGADGALFLRAESKSLPLSWQISFWGTKPSCERVEGSEDARPGGAATNGWRLAICSKIVRQAGGELWRHGGEGERWAMTFTLPKGAPDEKLPGLYLMAR